MKAVIQTGYGPPGDVLELREVAKPEPAAGEVLVRVRAASVHADVWHVVMGLPYVMRLMGSGVLRPNERVPGTDFAGVVEAVGAGVADFRPGDEVFGESFRELAWKNGGTFAEYAAVPADTIAPKPPNVSFEQAATVPTSGYIVLINLRGDRVKPGHRVLVNGAVGGVGSIAVQLAREWGAHVTGVDHTDRVDLLRALGADRVIDYTREDFTRGEERYDLVLDVASTSSRRAASRVLTPTGAYIVIGHDHYGHRGRRLLGSFPQVLAPVVTRRLVRHLPPPGGPFPSKREAMATLQTMLASGKLTPVVDSAFPLSQVAEAIHHLAEGNPLGRIVVAP